MTDSKNIKHWLQQQHESRVNKKKHKRFKQTIELIEVNERHVEALLLTLKRNKKFFTVLSKAVPAGSPLQKELEKAAQVTNEAIWLNPNA